MMRCPIEKLKGIELQVLPFIQAWQARAHKEVDAQADFSAKSLHAQAIIGISDLWQCLRGGNAVQECCCLL